MSTVINKPTLGGTSIPFPSATSIDPLWGKQEHITLAGTTRRELSSRKYGYKLTWDYMTVTDYDALEAKVNGTQPMTFIYEKWPQSDGAGVSVLAELSPRTLQYGTGKTAYLSSVTLTLTEVSSRI